MSYYKIEYTGRNTMGCNSRAKHFRIVPGMNDITAIQSLKEIDHGRHLPWPHSIESIELVEASNDHDFEMQEIADARFEDLLSRQDRWNKILTQ